MPVTLVTTLSGETSNSYIDVAAADSYWASHYSSTKASAWASISAAGKAMALVHSCRSLETLKFTNPTDRSYSRPLAYDPSSGVVIELQDGTEPVKATLIQALQFPRNLDRYANGTYYIPDAAKNAQAEQALFLVTFDEDAAADRLRGLDYESVTAGQVSVTQRFGASSGLSPDSRLAPVAIELIRPYLLKSTKLRRA